MKTREIKLTAKNRSNLPKDLKPYLKKFKNGTSVKAYYRGNNLILKPSRGKTLTITPKTKKKAAYKPKIKPQIVKNKRQYQKVVNKARKRKQKDKRRWNLIKLIYFGKDFGKAIGVIDKDK